MKIAQVRPNRLCIQHLLEQGSQPPSLVFDRRHQGSRQGWRKVFIVKKKKKKKRFQVCSDWNFVGMEKLGRLIREGHLLWLVWQADLAFSPWSWVGIGEEISGSWNSLTKFRSFFRGCWLFGFLSWLLQKRSLWVRDLLL